MRIFVPGQRVRVINGTDLHGKCGVVLPFFPRQSEDGPPVERPGCYHVRLHGRGYGFVFRAHELEDTAA